MIQKLQLYSKEFKNQVKLHTYLKICVSYFQLLVKFACLSAKIGLRCREPNRDYTISFLHCGEILLVNNNGICNQI